MRRSRITVDDVRRLVEAKAAAIGATPHDLPSYGTSTQDGRPHIEVGGGEFHYVSCERGHEYERTTVPELNEILYIVLKNVAWSVAGRWEREHRTADGDVREAMTHRWIVLLATLDLAWGRRLANEIRQQRRSDRP